jgi:TRAP transporter 4TM/12TM fusion protein
MTNERALDTLREGLRAAAGVLLLAAITAWIVDLPGMLGLALYEEQFLALVLGCSAALLLGRVAPGSGAARQLSGVLAIVLAMGLFGHVALNYPDLQLELVNAHASGVALALALLACVLEASRRQTGPVLPALVLLMAAFALWIGPMLPAAYATREVSFTRLAMYLALDTNAMISKILSIAAVVVGPFVVFGALLNAFGGSAMFSTLAERAVGRYRGGEAKVAVVGSSLFGIISGSAVANVVTSGAVSIPMMMRSGFSPRAAAAIEAVASTGGQLMPPIMGASAFLMAELLEIPYRDVAIAAIAPSLLYYGALFLAVDLQARALRVQARGGADARLALGWSWRFILPLAVLLMLLFGADWTPELAGVTACASLVVVFFLAPDMGFGERLAIVWRGLREAMVATADIALLSAAAGLVIGVLNLSGISFAVTMQIFQLSGGSLVALLALTAALSLLLGMGLPTVGVYILLATLVAPALVKLGVSPLAAHFYVMFFGMLSMITPPVAIASFAAASIARTSPWQASMATLRLTVPLFLIPIAFALNPQMLSWGAPGEAVLASLLGLSAVWALVQAVEDVFAPTPRRLSMALLALVCMAAMSAALAPVWLRVLIAAASLVIHGAVIRRQRR